MGDKDSYDKSFPNETLYVEAPTNKIIIHNITLGESGTAIYNEIEKKGLKNCLMIAAD